MSAGTQLQMAPQTTVVQGGQQTTVHNQDSNMSTGSSHSDKEIESAGTPEKLPRTPLERKRKRKAPDSDSGGPGGGIGGGSLGATGNNGGSGGVQTHIQNNKGPRVLLALPDTKKINDYFNRTASSPIRHGTGAKSPSPQHGYPMYPPSPQPQLNVIGGAVVNTDFVYKSRNTSNIVPSQLIQPLPPPCQPPPPPAPPALPKVSQSTQTELSYLEIQERDSEFELSKTKLDDLTRLSDEQKCQITAHQKVIEQHKNHISKCIDVVKKLLKEKSNIEKKEARQKCMQNRLRLGQFVTQRVGATFQENWTDGYAFQELTRRQEEISAEREEIDRQKKLLTKKRPSNAETGRKRNNSTTTQTQATPAAVGGVGANSGAGGGGSGGGAGGGGGGGASGGGGGGGGSNASNASAVSNTSAAAGTNLHNGSDATFLKPDPVSGGYTQQEYYECDEILKLRQNALKKEDADLQLETEKLERERNLHIRELKRIHNEDQV